MPFDPTKLIKIDPETQVASGDLFVVLASGMIPPDIAEEHRPAAEKGVADMAKGIADGLQPLFDYIDTLETNHIALEERVLANENAMLAANASLEPLLVDFGSLTSGTTGLEGLLSTIQTELAKLSLQSQGAGAGGATQ
jgi:hypothetical protein